MRYRVLATDYDGTIAHHGRVDEPTLAALDKVRESGRKLFLVTGRELEELIATFPGVTHFDCVVAENGGFLYYPPTGNIKLLAPAPSLQLVDLLRERKVAPMSVGRTIIATWDPFLDTVTSTIKELGLDLQVILNKGAVMVLPLGVNKATGLDAALKEVGLTAEDVVGVGDAENDHAFLTACGACAAVSNALPTLKACVDIVLERDHGAGVTDLINELVRDDLESILSKNKPPE
jgi:HAD superfamily hydrolase (TIGR01484 family)